MVVCLRSLQLLGLLLLGPLLLVLLAAEGGAAQVTLYVDKDMGSSGPPCTTPGSGACDTLTEAIYLAQEAPAEQVTIQISPGGGVAQEGLNQIEMVLDGSTSQLRNLTIECAPGQQCVLDGKNEDFRVLDYDMTGSVTSMEFHFVRLTFKDNRYTSGHSAIFFGHGARWLDGGVAKSVTFRDCIFDNVKARHSSISRFSGKSLVFNMIGCDVQGGGNTLSDVAFGGLVTLEDTDTMQVGGVHANIEFSAFQDFAAGDGDPTSSAKGGILQVSSGTFSVRDSTFNNIRAAGTGPTVSGQGGLVFVTGQSLGGSFYDSSIAACSVNGDAVANGVSPLGTILYSESPSAAFIVQNITATSNFDALFAGDWTTLDLENSDFLNNVDSEGTAGTAAPVVYSTTAGTTRIQSCNFRNNQGRDAGVLLGENVRISDSSFESNTGVSGPGVGSIRPAAGLALTNVTFPAINFGDASPAVQLRFLELPTGGARLVRDFNAAPHPTTLIYDLELETGGSDGQALHFVGANFLERARIPFDITGSGHAMAIPAGGSLTVHPGGELSMRRASFDVSGTLAMGAQSTLAADNGVDVNGNLSISGSVTAENVAFVTGLNTVIDVGLGGDTGPATGPGNFDQLSLTLGSTCDLNDQTTFRVDLRDGWTPVGNEVVPILACPTPIIGNPRGQLSFPGTLAVADLNVEVRPAVPTTGAPTTGVPTTGVPTTGVPTTGAPTTGIPTTGMAAASTTGAISSTASPTASVSGSVTSPASPPPPPSPPSPPGSPSPPGPPSGGGGSDDGDQALSSDGVGAGEFPLILVLAIGGGSLCLLCILALLLFLFVRHRRRQGDAKPSTSASSSSDGGAEVDAHAYELSSANNAPSGGTGSAVVGAGGPGPRKLDGVRIERVLGQGQYGQVFLGVHESKKVAVKQVLQQSPEAAAEFERELAMLMSVQSEHVVSVFGVTELPEEHGGALGLVMEFCPNGSLDELLPKKKGDLDVQGLLQLGAHIADGLSAVAAAGIVHRDLACRNVLVDALGVAKLADFGLARDVGEDAVYMVSTSMIPVRWSSPETIADNIVTAASDVYALGSTLLELFDFGALPFQGMSNQGVMAAVLKGERPPRPEAMPADVYDLCLACMHAEPEKRPSAKAVTRSLEDMLPDTATSTTDHQDQLLYELIPRAALNTPQ